MTREEWEDVLYAAVHDEVIQDQLNDYVLSLEWEIAKLRKETVRCCDCIYYVRDTNPIDPGWHMMCELTGMDMVSPDCFCAWGESKR